ncbi:peptide ABC transporter ATP-binding protein [Paenibacillus sp. FSL H8-0548]|uniref:ABC transporter ATP-binding protein n=1 Tax=Paenibacillus sp. FSL H8-0548 TaxID=1920422 RepID=UPI00096F7C6B|nr:ABC transporter ATP-binding protein [Paenibacillus sp. FSL H8-0548]OMF37752.1 peptide ABC transporter ATP-binding protein [Paenibacillus sp. FSL H8-0548]
MDQLLEVRQLRTAFRTEGGEVISVDDVSFSLRQGETLGIVGESGCGKSVTSLSILKLLGRNGYIKSGSIRFNGTDLTTMPEKELGSIRGRDIAMVFQDPMSSLNPVYTIGNQLSETIRIHLGLNRKDTRELIIELLKKVGFPRAEQMMDQYPHTLSGGMKQRVMIAMALACRPKLLIADEPTTALDVTIQAQILELIRNIRTESNTSVMLITHDLGVVAENADRIIVMYAGQVVEEANVYELFDHPKHPYTVGLMGSIPHIDSGNEPLRSIPGTVPSLQNMPSGCRYQSRCTMAQEICGDAPPLVEVKSGHHVRCWLANDAALKHGIEARNAIPL